MKQSIDQILFQFFPEVFKATGVMVSYLMTENPLIPNSGVPFRLDFIAVENEDHSSIKLIGQDQFISGQKNKEGELTRYLFEVKRNIRGDEGVFVHTSKVSVLIHPILNNSHNDQMYQLEIDSSIYDLEKENIISKNISLAHNLDKNHDYDDLLSMKKSLYTVDDIKTMFPGNMSLSVLANAGLTYNELVTKAKTFYISPIVRSKSIKDCSKGGTCPLSNVEVDLFNDGAFYKPGDELYNKMDEANHQPSNVIYNKAARRILDYIPIFDEEIDLEFTLEQEITR